jgi:tRNA A-37 threonylcarbamoyl transferase component Bud32
LAGVDGTKLDPRRLTTLEILLKHKFGATIKVEVVRRFESRKNVVLQLRIGGRRRTPPIDVVAKLFVTNRFEKELQMLRTCRDRGLNVPEVLAGEQGVILMSFISGELLVERINRTFDPELIGALADWYYKYHTAHGLTKGDPKLRNFICSNTELYGLDFEESQSGDWILDIGGIAASLLDTTPIFDIRKRKLAWLLLERYLALKGETRNEDIDASFVQTVSNALKETAYWRRDDSLLVLAKNVSEFGISVD